MLTKEQIVREWGLDLVDPNAVFISDLETKMDLPKKEDSPLLPALDDESARIVGEVEYEQAIAARKVIRWNADPLTRQEANDKRAELTGDGRFKETANLIFFPVKAVRQAVKDFEKESWSFFDKHLAEFASPSAYLVRRAKALATQVVDLESMLETFPELDYTGGVIASKGKERKVFNTLEAAVEDGFKEEAILKCLDGFAKTHRGYRWEIISFSEEETEK